MGATGSDETGERVVREICPTSTTDRHEDSDRSTLNVSEKKTPEDASCMEIPADQTSTNADFLLLGEGDFSYSLDLVRYLSACPSALSGDVCTTRKVNPKNKGSNQIRVITTGVDTYDELLDKYKDTPYVLRQLQKNKKATSTKQGQNPNNDYSVVDVEIKHGINAIVPSTSSTLPNKQDDQTQTSHVDADERNNNRYAKGNCQLSGDHVIFNHPHLGTEDAQRHARFLCHLFHSATNTWMKRRGGVFHLTLVEGQYERWRCLEAAQRHGLVLLETNKFRPPPPPPPPPTTTTKPSTAKKQRTKRRMQAHYQYRRHQNGKSFETRRVSGGSQTYTFGRANDTGSYPASCLPWQHLALEDDETECQDAVLPCPFCEKSFVEERSRKCHVRAKHTPSDKTYHQCRYCKPNELGEIRTFQSAQALQDHMIAKHTGQHGHILPDWHLQHNNSSINDKNVLWYQVRTKTDTCHPTTSTGTDYFGSCPICGLGYVDETHAMQHQQEFIPPPSSATAGVINGNNQETYTCMFCCKIFREDRARKQHENFCSLQSSAPNVQA